ncbi:MAG: L-aspartate oxidase [Methylococcaceae bacterium]|nr:MAG: L-aspartate oxidase [Methylococcaceae bacterium]
MSDQPHYDVLIIGSGAAGLSLALRLPNTARIAILAKTTFLDSNTFHAQGGISAVLNEHDTVESHIQDTLIAGAGLCDESIVQLVVAQGRACINWLRQQGMPFTQVLDTQGVSQLHLTREGGHTHRRVAHAADATGQALADTLLQKVREQAHIALFEKHHVIDLITTGKTGQPGQRVLGAYVLNAAANRFTTFRAKTVVLATGGASKVYLYTSNPDVATGDGIALAWRAGCPVVNMEFFQFHPTCLYHPQARSFLISEAVRGEGGRLLLPDGTPFMQNFDPRGELAPRDIVARAIDHEIKRLGIDCVYLDISHKPRDFILSHFPTIHRHCLQFNIDITRQPIPVVPAAHYTCGGVKTDAKGRTALAGLYAVGETAWTGLHGANRMASNSLLECLVFAKQAAEDIVACLPQIPSAAVLPDWDESQVTDSDEEVVVTHNWHEIRQFMWDYVGIVRTNKRLERALHRAELLKQEIAEYYGNFKVTSDLLELRNLVIVAELAIRCAMQRKESRGLHYTLDYPAQDDTLPPQNTILYPDR